jgi:hypothetical protein
MYKLKKMEASDKRLSPKQDLHNEIYKEKKETAGMNE